MNVYCVYTSMSCMQHIIKFSKRFTNNKANTFNNLFDFLWCAYSAVPVPQVYFALCST